MAKKKQSPRSGPRRPSSRARTSSRAQPSPPTHRLDRSVRTLPTGTRRTGPVESNARITVNLHVRRPPGSPEPPDIDYWRSHPPGHRTFVSHEEFGARYGALQEDLDKVTAYCKANGLRVTLEHRNRRVVIAEGTVAQMNRYFGVDLGYYEGPQGRYRGREGHIYVPTELAGIVIRVMGLDERPLHRSSLHRPQLHGGAANRTSTSSFRANSVPAGTPAAGTKAANVLYDFPTGGGNGKTIGILEFGGGFVVNSTTKRPSDVDTYLTSLGLSTVTVVPVSAGGSNSLAGSATNVSTTDPDVEVTLDISLAAAIAQSATIAVYFAQNDTSKYGDALSTAIHDSTNNPCVVSISWSGDESNFGDDARDSMEDALKDASVLGVTVLGSTGDNGSNGDGSVNDGQARLNYPSSDPWILSCGGTVLKDTFPTLTEASWSGSGGGVSVKYGTQSWQDGANVPPSVNDGITRGRGIPDVSANAGNGYDIQIYGQASSTLTNTTGPGFNPLSPGTAGPVGGTSCVPPLYAGLLAIINNNIGHRLGYLNPWLYATALTPGQTLFHDVNDGGSNAASVKTGSGSSAKTVSIPGYQCGAGWDPVTGWGSLDGNQLQNLLQLYFERTCTFSVRKSSFGLDEVNVTRPPGQKSATFLAALMILVDGCLPSELALKSASDLANPTLLPLITNLPSGVFADFVGPVQATDKSLPANLPQRFTYVFNLRFDDDSAFASVPATVTINATVAAADGAAVVPGATQLLLFNEGDPYVVNSLLDKNNVIINPAWLSADLRVFSIQANQARFGATMGGDTTAAPAYIQSVMSNLTAGNGTAGGNKFDDLSLDEEGSALHLFPTDSDGNRQFNFAIARVRLNGSSTPANHVRLFFRLFQAQTTATDYVQPVPYPGNGPYRTFSDGTQNGQKIPLLGVQGGEYVSVPFFANPRIDATANSMTAQTDEPNVRTINPVAGTEVDTFFGCYLDLNQTQQPTIPLAPPSTNIDGPYAPASLVSIAETLVRSPHQCLVAEISFDVSATDIPLLPNGASYSNSDKIAQRNIAWVDVPNPGLDASRRAPQPFEIQTANLPSAPGDVPDELVIDWGNTPTGSVASIYLPAVPADTVLRLASSMYTHHLLRRADDNTIQCPVGGLTYLPIPPGVSPINYVGLLSIDLPLGIVKGQTFKVTATQVTSVNVAGVPVIAIARATPVADDATSGALTWRKSIGSFQLTIPVKTKAPMLAPAESLLAYFKWIQASVPHTSRWYPILQRYVGQLSGRVAGLGGDPGKIKPSPTGSIGGIGGIGGTPPHHHPPTHPGDPYEHPRDRLSFTGKIAGLIYDRFGDFEGFVLDTDHGDRLFESREAEIEILVKQAWIHRIRLTVLSAHHTPMRAQSIILLSPPAPYDA